MIVMHKFCPTTLQRRLKGRRNHRRAAVPLVALTDCLPFKNSNLASCNIFQKWELHSPIDLLWNRQANNLHCIQDGLGGGCHTSRSKAAYFPLLHVIPQSSLWGYSKMCASKIIL